MALRKFSLPIIFALMLLFAQVLARDLEEKPAADQKGSDAEVDQFGYGRGPYGRGPYGRFPPRCRFYCGRRCCSEAEFAAYSQVEDEFGDEKQYGYGYGRGGYGYGRRPGYGYRPPYCRFRCGYRCCSAEEYAEFVQDKN